MKKFGFTLAEVLTALSIVGVMTAIVAPTVTNLAPDKNKAIYLDYFNKISNTTQKMLSDSSVYYKNLNLENGNEFYVAEGCVGLGCTSSAQNQVYSRESGNRKYPYLIAIDWGLNLDDCAFGNGESILETSDGIEMSFTPTPDSINVTNDINAYVEGEFMTGGTGDFRTLSYVVEMRLPSGGRECFYDADACPRPRWYIYNIDTYGNVTPGDALSRAYLQNQHKMNNKQRDYDCAAELSGGAQSCAED